MLILSPPSSVIPVWECLFSSPGVLCLMSLHVYPDAQNTTQSKSLDPFASFNCSLNTATPQVFFTVFSTSLSSHSVTQSCGPPLLFPIGSGVAVHSCTKSGYSHGVGSVSFPLLPCWYYLFCFLKELTGPDTCIDSEM